MPDEQDSNLVSDDAIGEDIIADDQLSKTRALVPIAWRTTFGELRETIPSRLHPNEKCVGRRRSVTPKIRGLASQIG
ncbi:hypothetical protein ASG54_18950 [Aureimonas sp. Leaf460]|nr:hypothetical protein ASG62_12210 [Aureimonas sp. Leaf427]KQT71577.1 hypothetical protein ASG54_18950 [Aureimonas sp. Leaf460]